MKKINWKQKLLSKDFIAFLISFTASLLFLFYLLSFTNLFIENMKINPKADENVVFVLFIFSACFSIYMLIKSFIKE